MAISIGNYSFVGPLTSTSGIEDRAGVYAVLHNSSGNNYTIVDIGESATVKSRLETHDRKPCWIKQCANPHYAVYYTPNLHQSGRMDIEQDLRRKYQPLCGSQ